MEPTASDKIPTVQLENMLKDMAARLIANLETDLQSVLLECASLDDLVREAETAQHRRSRHSARDRACYRLGAAFEPGDGLGLDDLSFTGLDCLGRHGLLLLLRTAMDQPKAKSLSQMLARLFASHHGALIREWGAHARWHWNHELYQAETTAFLASPAGRDPQATWRRGLATARQTYLIEEIARAMGVVTPRFMLRGQAFDWIQAHGGNPRWQAPPATPELPRLDAVSRRTERGD